MLKIDNLDDITFETVLIEGRPWSLFDNGTLLPVVRGGDGEEGDGEGEEGEEGEGEGGKPADRTLTQAQVDRIVAREKAKAERETKRKVDDYLASQKGEQDRATMDEATRLKAEGEEAKAEGERIRAEATRERLTAKIERKLSAAGVADKAIERASRLVNLEADASDDDIVVEIDALKEDMPGLFAKTDGGEDDEGDDGKGKGAPSGVTTGAGDGRKKTAGTKTAMERGADRWRDRAKKTTSAA